MKLTLPRGGAAIALCLSSVPALAQMPAPTMAAATNQAMPYLAMAGEGDVYEVTSSQIAIQRSRDPQVRAFATMLIGEHTRTTNLALAAAKTAGVTPPPPVLGTQQRAMIGQLLSAPAADFDRIYLQQQVPAHQTALALHSGYAANGDEAALRTVASGAVPIIRQHLERVQAMQSAAR